MKKEFISNFLTELLPVVQEDHTSWSFPTLYPVLSEYFDNFNSFPSILRFKNSSLNHIQFSEISFQEIFDKLETVHPKLNSFLGESTLISSDEENESIVQIYRSSCNNFYYKFCYFESDSKILFSEIKIYFNPDALQSISSYKEFLKETFKSYFSLAEITNDSYEISLVTLNSTGGLSRSSVRLNSEEFKELDLHYGNGFSEYYSELKQRLQSTNKGLVILNGVPGSGKTFLLKNLIKELTSSKMVFYISYDMAENLMRPEFLEFLQGICQEASQKNKNILLILEDCEKLVINRMESNSSGVGVLLNLSSGVLNDIFNVQTILTFNTEISTIDPAFLRSNRLISQKYFGYLSSKQIKKFNELYSLDFDVENKSISVSDIYAKKNNFMPLLDVLDNSKEQKIFGFHTQN